MTDSQSPLPPPGEELRVARAFHDAYERLAPLFGYETRPDTREFDPESPNGRLMAAVVAQVLPELNARGEEATGLTGDEKDIVQLWQAAEARAQRLQAALEDLNGSTREMGLEPLPRWAEEGIRRALKDQETGR